MAALGQELLAAGHRVTFCAPENFRDLAQGVGLRFVKGAADVQTIVQSLGERAGNPVTFLRVARQGLDESYERLDEACQDVDVLVGTPLSVACATIAEQRRLPLLWACYFPASFPTSELPTPLYSGHARRVWFNEVSWWATRVMCNLSVLDLINRQRARRKLAPIRDVFAHEGAAGPYLLAFDAELAPPIRDATVTTHPTGFWFLESNEPLPAPVEAFLSDGEPPVYIGFGSMPSDDPAGQTRILADAVEIAGCRALLSAGWAGLGQGLTSPRMLTIGPVNHSLLLPRMAAVVHHGGAGTVAAAARAGVPQIVAPHIFDQFYWSRRVHEVGLGPPPLPVRFTARQLADALVETLASRAMQERAREVGERLRRERGTRRAAEIIERVARG
jgi:vancomycin aglycone glucosyltransferase